MTATEFAALSYAERVGLVEKAYKSKSEMPTIDGKVERYFGVVLADDGDQIICCYPRPVDCLGDSDIAGLVADSLNSRAATLRVARRLMQVADKENQQAEKFSKAVVGTADASDSRNGAALMCRCDRDRALLDAAELLLVVQP